MRLLYRARQFWLALGGQPKGTDLALAARLLPASQMTLFTGMQPSEQAHAFQVLHQLLEEGEGQPDLLGAALLHDCGKQISPLSLFGRVWVVLAQRLFPKLSVRWGQVEQGDLDNLPAWRLPLVVAVQHPLWGAALARQAGASNLVQALIARHQQKLDATPESLEDELLAKLQAADNQM